ncbi:hypothetical protein RVM24_07685 [Marinobacter sp. KM021]|uniref:hypothetical protein n=1 Tax=Marinobacter sp. KM021 TaxID=3075616 RepID=UPI003D6A5ECA
MKSFKDFLKEKDGTMRLMDLFEHKTYKNIPGTKCSYREDPANTNTMTQKHAHTYAKPKGRGRQLYSVNLDGSGHDGSSGTEIPRAHADYFRAKGYEIDTSNILESLDLLKLKPEDFELITLLEQDT